MAKKKKKVKRAPAPAAKRKKKVKPKAAPKRKAKKKVKEPPAGRLKLVTLDGFLIAKGSAVLRASFDSIEIGEFPLGDAHVFDSKKEAKDHLAAELARQVDVEGAPNLFEGAEVVPVKQIYAVSYDVNAAGLEHTKDYQLLARVVRVGDSPVSLGAAIKAHAGEFKRQVEAAKAVLKTAETARISAELAEKHADNDFFKAKARLEDYLAWAKYRG